MNFIIQSECVCSSVDRAMASGAVCVGSIPIRCIFLLQKAPLAASGRGPGAGLAPQISHQPLWFFQKGQGIQDGCGTQVRTA